MTRPDLIVVGAGPAGASLAALAAGRGARVLLLERARFPRDKVCGEFIAADGLAVLERLGLLGQLAMAGARPMDHCQLTAKHGGGLALRLSLIPGVPHAALGVTRALLDHALLELAAQNGAEVHELCEVSGPLVDGGRVTGVRARRTGSRGNEQQHRAALVVAADGRRSILGRSLHPQLGDPQRSYPHSWFGLKVHLSLDPSRLVRRVELHLFDGGYAGLAPVEGGRTNLCLLARVRELRASGSPQRLLARCLAQNPAARESVGPARPSGEWQSVGPLRFAARRPAAAGVLFVGDAAGTIDPFCGEGISHALRAAELALPFALTATSRGGLDDTLAQGYSRSWRRSFAAVTRRARLLGMLLGRTQLAGCAIGVLHGAGPSWLPRLVHGTRACC